MCEGCVRAVCVGVCVCLKGVSGLCVCVWDVCEKKGVHGGQILGRCINFRFTKTLGAPSTSRLKKKNIFYKKLSGQCCTFEGTVSREKHGVLSCKVLLRCAFPSRLVKHAKFR